MYRRNTWQPDALASFELMLYLASTGDGGGVNKPVEEIYFNLSPWLFPQMYPGHLGFWPMKKTNTVMFTKYLIEFLSI